MYKFLKLVLPDNNEVKRKGNNYGNLCMFVCVTVTQRNIGYIYKIYRLIYIGPSDIGFYVVRLIIVKLIIVNINIYKLN